MIRAKRLLRRFSRRALRRALRRSLIAYARGGHRGTPAAPSPDGPVTIVLVSAWGMGGTIRAALNLADYAAQRHDVEILSIFRKRETPFFGAFGEGVRVTALDDLRPSAALRGPKGMGIGVLRRLSSVLIHPSDRYAQEHFNLWTDIQLVRRLRGRSGFLVMTRPGLNLMAADLAPPGIITVGLEQMHLDHHVAPLRRAMPAAYPQLDAFVVLTEGQRERYDRHLKGRGRLVVIPNTVRPLGGRPADPSAKVIFAAGRLVDQKGFDMLIEAFASVAAAHPDWRLRICGRGARRPDLEARVERLGLSDAVTLAPPSDDIQAEMAAASTFVLSSRFEGFPLILIEALSKQMAVVAFDCPTGPSEVIDDHRNGLLVPAKDVPALAAAMLEMVGDEELRRTCGAAGAQTAAAYTMDAIGPRWEALFARLARERAGAAAYDGAGGGEPAAEAPGDGAAAVGAR